MGVGALVLNKAGDSISPNTQYPTPHCGIIALPKRAARSRAVGSVVERLVHTEEVTGSNPVLPTIVFPR